MLDKFSEAIRGNLHPVERHKLAALVTIEVQNVCIYTDRLLVVLVLYRSMLVTSLTSFSNKHAAVGMPLSGLAS